MPKELVGVGLVFVVLAVALMIGASIIEKTHEIASGSLANQTYNDLKNAINTLTGFVPVIAIAAVGGLAIAYILGFAGGRR
jgi:ABC-type anion transport system duplicated permease subunit